MPLVSRRDSPDCRVGICRLLATMLTAATVVTFGAGKDGSMEVLPVPGTPSIEASNPAADAPHQSTLLEANGFAVTLDTDGFRPQLGYERFKGNYFRLAMFTTAEELRSSSGGGFTFSLLVDDLPGTVKDLKALFRHCVVTNKLIDRLKDGSLQPLKSPRAANGLLFRYPQRLPVPPQLSKGGAAEFTQWHWYFESIQNGKWFEIHFSRGVALGAPVPEGIEADIDHILRSLQFSIRAPAK